MKTKTSAPFAFGSIPSEPRTGYTVWASAPDGDPDLIGTIHKSFGLAFVFWIAKRNGVVIGSNFLSREAAADALLQVNAHVAAIAVIDAEIAE